MRLQRQFTAQPVLIDDRRPLGSGGEAHIYALMHDTELVAKLYHRPTEAQARKLRAMLAAPPEDPAEAAGQRSIAWPADLLLDGGRVVGFVMPRVAGRSPIFNFYNPSVRRQQFPLSNAAYLHRTARNLASAVRALHAKGYVIGDVNESNILVTQTALVTLVDTDSFQVGDPQTGAIYRCPVGKIEFTPPELQGETFADRDRTPEQDAFGLAILIFQLLMEGTHPFAGVFQGAGEPPPYEARIRAGHFVFGTKSVPYRLMPSAPPFSLLNPNLQRLFVRCFEEGHTNPPLRPTAQEWRDALAEAEEALVVCTVNRQHRYDAHNALCPWCERTRKLGGRDPFPSPEAVQRGQHLRRAPRRATLPEPAQAETMRTPYNLPVPPRPVNSAPAGSGSQRQWSYTAPPPGTPAPNFILPRNLWALLSLTLALLALLPALHLLAGLSAVAAGGIGVVEASRRGLGGQAAAAAGAFFGLTMCFLSLLVRPEAGVLHTAGRGVLTVALAPDGRTLAAGTRKAEYGSSAGGTATLWDTISGQELTTLGGRHGGDVTALAYNSAGDRLAVGSWGPQEAGDVEVWNIARNTKLWSAAAHESTITAVVFSPDGALLATSGAREWVRTREIFSEIKLWNAQTGDLTRTLTGAGEVFAVAFSPDGKRIAAGCGGSGNGTGAQGSVAGRVEMWDIASGNLLWLQKAHSTAARTVAFSPDGLTLVSGGEDNALRLWDANGGRLRTTFEGSGYRTGAAVFSPDGSTIASGGNDARIMLWNAASGTIAKQFTGHTDEIRSLAFSRDGKTLVSGSQDGTVRIWHIL